MSFAAMGELENLLQALAQREDVNVVVLTGGVPGYFVAHADLDDLSRLGRGEPVEGDPLSWTRTLALIESSSIFTPLASTTRSPPSSSGSSNTMP